MTEVVAAALAHLDAGGQVDDAWLRRRAPRGWREARRLLRIRAALDRIAPATPRTIGRYRLIRRIGRGGMGTVYLAEDPLLPKARRVAVKVLHPHLVDHPGAAARALREARAGARVQHACLVATLDAGIDERGADPLHYVVTEFVEGTTVRDRITAEGSLPEEVCRLVAGDVGEALAALHAAGIVHRDVKPENVMLDGDGRARLMDLGLARIADESVRISQSGAFVGSASYAAPEQFAGERVDGRADLYSLGLVLHEMASGRHPFVGAAAERRGTAGPPRLDDTHAAVSPFFAAVVATLLEPDPADRFASAAALLRCLDAGAAGRWWRARRGLPRRSGARGSPLDRADPSFVGRDDEFARLDAAWRDVTRGHGRGVLLTGDAGIGKTRTVAEFLRRVGRGASRPATLGVRFPAGGAAAGLEPFRESLDAALDAVGRKRRADRRRGSAESAWVRALVALSLQRPVAVHVDDAQYAAPAAIDAVSSLLAAAGAARILVVVTARPDLDPRWASSLLRHPHVERRELPPLAPDDVARLVAAQLDGAAAADDVAAVVGAKSGGNPLFVREMVRLLERDGGLVRTDDGRWRLDRPSAAAGVPDSLRALVETRIAGLPAADRDVLDAAACAGARFDAERIAAAVSRPMLQVLRSLAELRRAPALLQPSEHGWSFHHPLFQEVAYDTVAPDLRRALHASLAEWFTAASGDADESDAADAALAAAADHWVRAGRGDRVPPIAERAAEWLLAVHDNGRAGVVLDAALAHAPRGDAALRVRLLLLRAALLDRLGRRGEEVRVLDDAVRRARRAESPVLAARAVVARGACRIEMGDAARALAELRPLAGRIERSLPPGDRIRLAAALAKATRFSVSDAAAIPFMRRELALARAAGDTSAVAHALGDLGVAAVGSGRPDDAVPHYEEGLRAARHADDPVEEARLLGLLGSALSALGRREAALRHFRDQLALARSIGSLPAERHARTYLPSTLAQLGRASESIDAARDAILFASFVASPRVEAVARLNACDVLRSLGRRAEARAWLERAAEIGRELADAPILCFAELVAADQFASEGRNADAARAYQAVLDAGAGSGAARWRPAALLGLGSAAWATESPAAGRVWFERARDAAVHSGDARTEWLAKAWLARTDREGGATVASVDVPDAPLTCIDTITHSWLAWKATDQRRWLRRAHTRLNVLREHAPREDRRALIEEVPMHREIWRAARKRPTRRAGRAARR